MNSVQQQNRILVATSGGHAPGFDEPYPRQTALFLLLMLVNVGLRLWLLMVSRHYLQSDEAVVAMEALDILEGGPIPYFLYGQVYGGGHTVEALLAIPWFAVFGPSDYLFKLGPLIVSCLFILVVYSCLYRFFDKKYALIAAAVLSLFPPFLYFNFHANGGMAMSLFGWLGLYAFLRSYFAERESPWNLFLSGAAIGFAYYCFDAALYYLLVVVVSWIIKENSRLWRGWRSMLGFLFGFFVGALPLIYYNVTHEFINLKFLLSATAQRGDDGPSVLTKFAVLLYHDLPAFFSVEIDDFPLEISPLSYFSYGLFVISVLYVIVRMRASIVSLPRWFLARRIILLPRQERVLYLSIWMFLYFALYSLAARGGSSPRYLMPLCPVIPLILAWAVYDLGKRDLIPAVLFITLFGAAQLQFIGQFAKDKTTVEWGIRTLGEDIKAVAKFLLDNNLTTVATPYEIKWKLMFESQRRIVCAAYLFGFDRERKYNLEAIDRVNRRGLPLAYVFDREYLFSEIARTSPARAFDLSEFREHLRQNGITYQMTPVGQDYVVYHDFSRPIPLPDPQKFIWFMNQIPQ